MNTIVYVVNNFIFNNSETSKLWQFLQDQDDFEFKTIEDILNELDSCTAQNECLSETLNTTLATIQSELQRLSSENVQQKSEIEQLLSKTDEQKSEIARLSSENVEQKSELERLSSETDEQNTEITRLSSENVDQNSELEKLTNENVQQQETIDEIDDILEKMSGLPLGSIIPWVNRPNIDSHYTIEDIPDGWQR